MLYLDLSDSIICEQILRNINLNCTDLESLVLDECWDIKDEDMIFFIKHCNKLKKLHLKEARLLTDQVLRNIGLNCPDLESLTLNNCRNITDESIIFLMKHCKKLKKLCLSNAKLLTNEFLFKISVYLPRLCHLSLWSFGKGITFSGFQHLGKSKAWKEAHISGINLNDWLFLKI